MADFANFAFIIKLNSSEIIQLTKTLFALHKKWYISILKLVHNVTTEKKTFLPTSPTSNISVQSCCLLIEKERVVAIAI